ncbi:hypothetical protein O181_079972 [Austropuccinia psidii MF-1]|uniref:Uncharacterized protein n=1 Tax=Austropuccinia psidii MF-1 TaxID=1389203 RepID=A0A9Q3FN25_9BASI|nr:hypothetical protein [Austropuccinia psidii MF-1]
MPFLHSPPARKLDLRPELKGSSHPTPGVPLGGMQAFAKLRAYFDRKPVMKGEAPSRKERSKLLICVRFDYETNDNITVNQHYYVCSEEI